jgi:predicted secreted protein
MAGVTGVGTVLKRETVPIANILSISGPNASRETVDITVLDAADGFRDFISGLRDGGTLSFEMLFTKAGYDAMNDDFLADEPVDYTIELPDDDDTIIGFSGLVTGFPVNIPLTDTIKISVTIKIIGDISID